MISFAAITPHPPIIIPDIGKDNLSLAKKTIEGMEKLARRLKRANPDVIIVISPHGTIFADAFSINLSEKYKADFKQFGDVSTKLNFSGDVVLTHRIFEKLEAKMPVMMLNNPKLDHGAAVPLYYLTQHIKNSSIIPIGYSLLGYQDHLDFGQKIKEEIF
ncbi:MAG: hypothetical protein PHY10_04085, partial [Patescibacteria group bacterium]|nr:hypothetical protein [Patescibacteria group bacterium]